MKVETYVVNLERSPDRRARMKEVLWAAGIKATFLPGIDIQTVKKKDLLKRFSRFGPWGQVGFSNMCCCSSHRQIWDHFLKSDCDFALILEDDVFVAPELSEWIENLDWLPRDADMIKFERWPSPTMRQIVGKRGASFRGRKISRLYSRHPGAAGYLISRRHAGRLIQIGKINLNTDQFLFNPYVSSVACRAKIFQVNPSLIQQGNTLETEKQVRSEKGKLTGWPRLHQHIQRGWAELRALPIHVFRVLAGQAEMVRLGFALEPITLLPQEPIQKRKT